MAIAAGVAAAKEQPLHPPWPPVPFTPSLAFLKRRCATALRDQPAAAEFLAAFLSSQPGAEALASPEQAGVVGGLPSDPRRYGTALPLLGVAWRSEPCGARWIWRTRPCSGWPRSTGFAVSRPSIVATLGSIDWRVARALIISCIREGCRPPGISAWPAGHDRGRFPGGDPRHRGAPVRLPRPW